jgi:putative ABC transport system ATP-binding protein
MSSVIKLEHVEQWYNKGKKSEVHALKDVTLEIEQGDYAAFFGPSGCGKTTLLYAISGIDKIAGGSISIKGQDIAKFSNQELAIFRQTGIGIIFQQFNLVPSLTVLENVALPMAFVGINKAKAQEEAAKLVKRFGLEEYAGHYPTELSGGQQQRVGIARALANNPPIIIADEPLGNLDSANAKNVLQILRDLNEQDGRTIIMVTHEAWSLQDVRTIFHMQDGSITSIEHKTAPGVAEGKLAGLKSQVAREARSSEHVDMVVRILSNFFMRGHTIDETQRFEQILTDRFNKKIDALKLQELLDKSFAEGGVGLWKKKAERTSTYIEALIEKQHDLETVIEHLEQAPDLTLGDEARKLRGFMLEEYVGDISVYKSEILDELISDRIRRFLSNEQFVTLLHSPVKEFGAGFPLHSAQRMAERLELIMEGTHTYDPVR